MFELQVPYQQENRQHSHHVVPLWRYVDILDGGGTVGLDVVGAGTSFSQIDALFTATPPEVTVHSIFAQNPFLAGLPTTQSLMIPAASVLGWLV